MVQYMEKVLGRKALADTNMPHPQTRNSSIHLAILEPNFFRTALGGEKILEPN